MTNGCTEEERLCRSQLQSNAISAKWENRIADLGVFFSGLPLQIDCIVCYCPILWKRSKEYKSPILLFFRFCYTTNVVCYCPILPKCNSRWFTKFPNVSLQKDSNCIIIGTLRYYKYKWLLSGLVCGASRVRNTQLWAKSVMLNFNDLFKDSTII